LGKAAQDNPHFDNMSHRKAVGIDLGTTFSAVAHIDAYGKPQIIPNSENERITPSVILFDNTNVVVGTLARNSAVAEPEKIVDFVKREMGKSKAQFHREFNGKKYSAEELSALILRKVKNDAEKYLKEPVTDAVITVPAYFNDAERTATITAGQLAGFHVLQIVNEPTAAALAYGLDKLEESQTVFVFDLGGGTFDVTIMEIQGHKLNIIATNGDHRLGGKDWDDVIVNYIAEEFDRVHGENPLLDLQSYQDLQTRAVAGKIQLSSRKQAALVHQHHGKTVKVDITRAEFESRCCHLIEKCKMICEMTLQDAKMKWDKINKILLVGGMTRMPMVRQMISGLSQAPVVSELNPDEAVAVGAAIQATLSMLQEEQSSGEKLLADNTRKQFSAREGGLMQVNDITSHTLGVVLWDDTTLEEYVFPMIRKRTAIPATAKNLFGTANANMPRAVVKIVEGESSLPAECTPLGVCDITLPPFLPKGSPVQLSYQYNTNQVLEVAVEACGQRSAVVIERNTGLAESEFKQAASGLGELTIE
jgi:molecular chaperone DnaK